MRISNITLPEWMILMIGFLAGTLLSIIEMLPNGDVAI